VRLASTEGPVRLASKALADGQRNGVAVTQRDGVAMTQQSSPSQARDYAGCLNPVVDFFIGAAEIVILFITVTTAAVAIPPDSAPKSAYDHVVEIYSMVVLITVLTAQLYCLIRRRWVISIIQLFITLAAIASIIILHRTRIYGGLTGY